jgi:mRNA interferase RelE/StbE
LSYQLQIGPQVRAFQATLGPEHRRTVKRALRDLTHERGDLRALREELSGWHRLKIGHYRLIFRYAEGRIIQCVFLQERKLVYEIFEAEMNRILGAE